VNVGGAALIASVILSAVAVVLCVGILYRTGRRASSISPLLEQRFLGIEEAIGRSNTTIRDEFGRGRDRRGNRPVRTACWLSEGVAKRSQQGQLDTFAARLNEARIGATAVARNLREEIHLTFAKAATAQMWVNEAP
jgi:hypothetical protein